MFGRRGRGRRREGEGCFGRQSVWDGERRSTSLIWNQSWQQLRILDENWNSEKLGFEKHGIMCEVGGGVVGYTGGS